MIRAFWRPRGGLHSVLALLLLLSLLAACAPPPPVDVGKGRPELNGHMLLAEVYPNGFAPTGEDQFIRLHNPTDRPIALGSWSIGDAHYRATFGPTVQVGPRQSLYLARDAEGFRRVMGALPDYVWTVATPNQGVPVLLGGAGFTLGRDAGLVVLRDSAGLQVDTLVYGSPPGSAASWRGPPAPAPGQGEVIARARDEDTWNERFAGEYTKDTDMAADWRQGARWLDLRIYRPGQTFFPYPTYQAERVMLYAAPDTAYRVIEGLIDGARTSIDLNVYSFTLVLLAERLAEAARRGVKVRLLMEGVIVGGINDQARYVARMVHDAGGEVRFQLNHKGMGIHGRYVFNHAKYAVIDGQRSFVQSENIGVRGTPVDPTYGNRGWGTVVEDGALSAYLSRVFASSWTQVHGDVLAYQPGTNFGPPPPDFVPDLEVPTGTYRHPFPVVTVRGPVSVTPVLAPDHSLLETKGVIGLMRSARESLLIEQMYAHMYWGLFPTESKGPGAVKGVRTS